MSGYTAPGGDSLLNAIITDGGGNLAGASGEDGNFKFFGNKVDLGVSGQNFVHNGNGDGGLRSNGTGGEWRFGANSKVNWSSDNNPSSAVADTGIERDAAGQVKVTDGSTGRGKLDFLGITGTWTPTLSGSGTAGSPTFSAGPSGSYTRYGSLVFAHITFTLSGKGGMAGSLYMSLPSGLGAANDNHCILTSWRLENLATLETSEIIGGAVFTASDVLALRTQDDTNADDSEIVVVTHLNDTTQMDISFIYETDFS